METLRAKTPVFTDESGRRVTVMQWMARGLCACLVLVGAAIAVATVTHVPLPGLGRLAPPTADSMPGSAQDTTADGGSALDEGLTAGSDPGSVDGFKVPPARSEGATVVARGDGDAVEADAAETGARPLVAATAAPAAQGAAPAKGSGSETKPQPQPTATASPTPSGNPPSHSNANPRAGAKSANSTGRATPHATAKPKNPRSTAARSDGQSSSASTSTPPGWTK